MKLSSVSPERCETNCDQWAWRQMRIASRVSVTVPIWLTLMSEALPTLRVIASAMIDGLVHKISSPTSSHPMAQPGGEAFPAAPVRLGQAVFEKPHRIALDDLGVAIDHVVAGKGLPGDVVSPVSVELARGRIHGDGHPVATGSVAGLLDGPDEQGEDFLGLVDLGREATLVSEPGGKSLCRQQASQGCVDLGARPHGFCHGRGAERRHHELLEVQTVGGVDPPLTTLKCGTGRRAVTPAGLRERQSARPAGAAMARAAAIDTPTMALAPRRALFSVPSRSIRVRSSSARSQNVRPRSPRLSPR